MGSGVWLDDIIAFISAQDIIMLICVLRNDIGLCVVHKVAPPQNGIMPCTVWKYSRDV